MRWVGVACIMIMLIALPLFTVDAFHEGKLGDIAGMIVMAFGLAVAIVLKIEGERL
jgi:hypothetical protein